MNSTVERYVIEQLAACSFAILAARIAFTLRSDLWATRLSCGCDFTEAIPKLRQFVGSLPGVVLLEIQLDASPDWVILATRSTDMLAQRVQWITGEAMTGLRAITETKPAQVLRTVDDANPIPSWPCTERTERLRALGIKDDLASGDTTFAPRRSSM